MNSNDTKIIENINNEKKEKEEIFITKWVDYSSKYGIGYLLNNQLIGVYFNDCTKLIYNPRTQKISFIERKVTKGKDMQYTFGLKEAPAELGKKVLIFQQFKKYLEEDINREKNEKQSNNKERKKSKNAVDKSANSKIEKEGENIFLTKWMKTSQAIIFRLSNKTIQVIFKDRSEITLFDDMVRYKDNKDIIKTYKIEDAINSSNFEMIKRIKYVLNIFTKTISFNSQKNAIPN